MDTKSGSNDSYRQEMDNLRHGANDGLVSKFHGDLTAGRILEYENAGKMPFAIEPEMNYDDVFSAFLEHYAPVPEQRQILSRLQRESLLSDYEKGETRFTVKYSLQPVNQLPIFLSSTVSLFLSPETGHIECFTYTFDITDKTLEEQVFSHLPMLGFDVVGILYVQTHVCRYFRIKKMRPESIYEHQEDYYSSIGGDIEKIVLPEQREDVRKGLRIETIQAVLEKEETYPFTYSMFGPKGNILQKLIQFSYLDASHATIFFCKSDITKQTDDEHRQIEELAAAKLEADKASEAKSMFLSSVSHDLRTPLNGVIGFTDLALRTDDEAKRLEYLEKIRTSGELLLALVNDTLDLSRIESGKYVMEPEALDCPELLRNVVTALQPQAESRHISLRISIGPTPSEYVWVDRLKLQKLFLNLLSNAVKYTLDGGTVTVTSGCLSPVSDGCNYRISIQDNGVGISAEFLPHIFEPFAQEHRKETSHVVGTGLGLSIVKRTVDLMHGNIRVDSEPGKGSCFTVDLPLMAADPSAAEKKENSSSSAVLDGKHVLLCEDNYLNAEIASTLLRERGILVDCAADGKEGLEKFSASAPYYYDAVLMDIRMPVMDGCEAAKAIHLLKRPDAVGIPIIAMTADALDDDSERRRAAGMSVRVTKPVNPPELFRVLEKAVAERLP
ncbi:MAG: ATP-binding protein [Lachnospiraceae bacterium]|jgi:signal transduction histidine kinase/BarA-like signal transduction histidine kinase|nr:ATP-binding protein [Lachnospiraceae bacterium]